MGNLVLRDDHDGWAQLTLNRPEKPNSLNVSLFAELRAHVEDISADDAINCVVLRGAGKC